MKIDRQLGILSILLQNASVTAPYLAEQFEVSRRTINRDIEDLCKAGTKTKYFLMAKKGVEKLPPQWNWIRYAVGGKMFAAVCLGEEDKPYYITLKLEPAEGDFLRQQYEGIIPGYYMNKTHWNSVKPNGNVPDELLKDLLEKSYFLVLGGFSKKKQREILGGAEKGIYKKPD